MDQTAEAACPPGYSGLTPTSDCKGPTLIELCQAEMPHKTSGKSMVGLLRGEDPEWEEAAYGYYNNGITVRVPGYRYTRYYRNEKPVVELYDHHNDPEENHNIASDVPELLLKFDKILEKGNTGLYLN